MNLCARSLVLFLALWVGGCAWGTRPLSFTPAVSPDGVLAAVRVLGETRDRVGELYAVDSIGVTMRLEQLTRVSWARLSAMDVHHMGRRLRRAQG